MVIPTPIRTPPTQASRRQHAPVATVEGRLVELQAQLDQLRAQVRQAQQLSTLGIAAATIAHEVNNLLTPLLGYAKAALNTNDAGLQVKALTVTVRNVEMLSAMADRVLEISAAKEPTRESVSLRSVIDDAAASLCRDLSKDGIRLLVQVDESLTVWVDRLQLQQVLFNLFLNAREAMAKGHTGRLAVSAVRRGDQVSIEVTNTGDCIPPELLPEVFEPLRSSKGVTPNGRHRCSGLGLALCRDLVEENGGSISVTSDPEAGTSFTITLSAAPAPSN